MYVKTTYVKTTCPVCQSMAYHSVELSQLNDAAKPELYSLEVRESLPEVDFVKTIVGSIRQHIHDGIEIREMCKILRKYYGIAGAYCCDLIWKIKIELDMYCPDGKRLYFVQV